MEQLARLGEAAGLHHVDKCLQLFHIHKMVSSLVFSKEDGIILNTKNVNCEVTFMAKEIPLTQMTAAAG